MAFAQIGQVYLLWVLSKKQKCGFLAIILAPEMLENRSSPLKTDYSLVSKKNLSQK